METNECLKRKTTISSVKKFFTKKLITIYSRLEPIARCFCVSELDGFLTALGCSIKELEPDLWLNAIWGADEDQPVWENTEQEDEFLSLVLNHVHGNHEQFVVWRLLPCLFRTRKSMVNTLYWLKSGVLALSVVQN